MKRYPLADAVERVMIERELQRVRREAREAKPLVTYYTEKPYYIAVCEHGFGVDKVPAMAIRLAQTEVPAASKPSQLLVYSSMSFVEPTDFKRGAPVWPNGEQPKLVGLTTTHGGYRQTYR
jgi:hypothetical protein